METRARIRIILLKTKETILEFQWNNELQDNSYNGKLFLFESQEKKIIWNEISDTIYYRFRTICWIVSL